MLFKPGLGAQYSGSIGGTTYSHNKGGVYARIRATPVNTPTVVRQAIKDAFGQLSSAWVNILTPAQRTGWEAYAAAVTVTNRIGAQVNINGLAMYVRSNTPRVYAGAPRVDDAPVIFDLGNLTAPTVSSVTPPTTVNVAFDNTDSWDNDGGFLFLFVSRPQNLTINGFHGSYQPLATVTGNTATPATSPVAGVSPFVFSAGQRLFLRATASQPDGRYSSSIFFQVDT